MARKAVQGEQPPAPAHLSAEASAWWRSVVSAYVLEGHHLKLLRLAAEAWDRCQQARVVLDAEGLTYTDRFGAPRTRPEAAVERDCRLAFARLVRELGLDLAEPDEARPPTRTGRKRG